MSDDADRVWQGSMPEAYERFLVPTVFRPFAMDLARRVGVRAPSRTLELAAGTGVLTRELLAAASSGTTVTATDFNDAMVEFGRERVPDAVWRQADAMDLPYDDATFDAVVCQFGVMFFPDRPAAFAEARRVLAPDGVLMVNTWASIETHAFQAALVAGLERAFPENPPTFMVKMPHGCADPDALVADVRAGGFTTIALATITLEGQAPSAADIARGYCTGTPVQAEIEARGDLESTLAIVTREMEARLGSGAVTGRMTAYVFEATL
jgi:SAM-dependent methyltransferase